jgi:[protein-PII] uridylyltransferase
MLEIFLLMTERPSLKGMTARATRALWHGASRSTPPSAPIRSTARCSCASCRRRRHHHALRRMNDLSILGRYLPNFRKIVGQMQHDLFHVYTVDQHILMVVRNMRRFTMAEHAHEYPFCSQLMANFGQPWVLYWRRCSTTSPRAAAATTPSSAWPTPNSSAATTA